MNQLNTPEATLSKALEFIKSGDDESAISTIYDFILNNKKKYWAPIQEQLLLEFIRLTIKRNKLKLLGDGLNYFRFICQANNIESFTKVLEKTKEMVEAKFSKAQRKFVGIVNNILKFLEC